MIQLSVAPAFLLVAVGSFINVATLRLGRVVDRARALEEQISNENDGEERQAHQTELRNLGKRMKASNYAIMLATFAALLVCLVVALLFIGTLTSVAAGIPLSILFILTMFVMVMALICFLTEILVATATLRIRTELLRKREITQSQSGIDN